MRLKQCGPVSTCHAECSLVSQTQHRALYKMSRFSSGPFTLYNRLYNRLYNQL